MGCLPQALQRLQAAACAVVMFIRPSCFAGLRSGAAALTQVLRWAAYCLTATSALRNAQA